MVVEPHLLLASRSPRRGQLLQQIGVRYRRVPAPVSEVRGGSETPESFVTRLALEKARSGLGHAGDGGQDPTLGADTAVVVDDRVLGKPGDRDQAFAMLKLLSGRMHRVLTAVALVGRGRASHALQESQVTFRHLTSEECRHYVSTGESLDKAGGYGIQGYAAAFVEHLEGSYSGVMGLPLFETWRLIVEFGIDVEWK